MEQKAPVKPRPGGAPLIEARLTAKIKLHIAKRTMIELERVFKFYRSKRNTKIILDHVSFRFEEGRSYGVLGVNGAGKSTLMRLLAGAEIPNGGRVRRLARISWPLGFSGALHPRLTGRDNVKFVARVYGQDRRKVVDFVEDFAEIGAFIDAPISSYSAGMLARLAFGLSLAIDFDCYLIDEVTAVGDARFAARCKEELDKRRRRSDLIVVSHAVSTIREFCDCGVVLADGRLHVFKDVDEAIELYKKLNA
jgi:capsular polysaccharide transport system ATP-binding protein